MQRRLAQKRSIESIEEEFTTAAFYIERELHQEVGPDYSALKFRVALEEIQEHYRKENEAAKGKTGTIGR